MRIYTGYFGNLKNYKGMVCCGITCYPPKWIDNIQNEKKYAPLPYMLKLDTEEEYIKEYTEKVLNKLNYKEVIEWFKSISNGKDVVIMCFEKPEQFCHRHLFAKWLNQFGEYEVKEFDNFVVENKKEIVENKFVQGELW